MLRFGPCSVWFYREIGSQHHGRHCHLRWAGGDIVVMLPEIVPLHGARLPARVLKVLRQPQDRLLAARNMLNEQE